MLSRFRTFMFDCDGTLWNQNGLINGALQLILHLKKTGRQCLLITNNSTKSTEQYVSKCAQLGLPIEEADIVCTANVAAYYLAKNGIKGPIYVIGQEGIGLELDKVGISYFGIGKELTEACEFNPSQLNPKTQAVLVGYDSCFNYVKLMKAATLINRGCNFYATNEDGQLPATNYVCPGTGSLVASVKVASGTDPIVFGKPHQIMFDFVKETRGVKPETAVMIGDRLDTDIAFGNTFNIHSVCVATGVTSEGQLAQIKSMAPESILIPDLVYPSVMHIYNQLRDLDRNLY